MFTRYHDDPARIKKQSEISTYAGRYYLDTPGQGLDLPFVEDPHIRLQGWGANHINGTIAIDTELRGLNRKLNRDHVDLNNYKIHGERVQQTVTYRTENPFVEQSRATHPAWMYRVQEHNRWEEPFINPLANIEKNFHDNINTRIIDKDNFVPTVQKFSNF